MHKILFILFIAFFLISPAVAYAYPDVDGNMPANDIAFFDMPFNTDVRHIPHVERKLFCKFNDMDGFNDSIAAPRVYADDKKVRAGVIPHHLAAASLIGGFFKMCAGGEYDAVVIIAPNHAGNMGDVIVSRLDWDVLDGVSCDKKLVDEILSIKISGLSINENDTHMENEHAASALIPYIGHYLPGVPVVPVLVGRTISLENTLLFAERLSVIIKKSEKRVLFVCSIDFSHYLPPPEARICDAETLSAIKMRNYATIHSFSNRHVDSPAALIIFLEYARSNNLTMEIIDKSDASVELRTEVNETTTYFIIRGVRENFAQLSFVGDLMAHDVYDYNKSFAVIKKYLRKSDYAIGNLETTLCGKFNGYPRFSAPDTFPKAIADAGFDFVSMANNHSCDMPGSVTKTIDALDEAGLDHSGTYKTRDENRVFIKDINNIKFAFLCYTYGINVPPGAGYVGIYDKDAVKSEIKKARDAGADVVIALTHMGTEYGTKADAKTREQVMHMLECGADVVIGSHPHIVHEMEQIEFKNTADGEKRLCFAAYSLGNFLSSQRDPPETGKGVLLNICFKKELSGRTFIDDISVIHTSIYGDENIIIPQI